MCFGPRIIGGKSISNPCIVMGCIVVTWISLKSEGYFKRLLERWDGRRVIFGWNQRVFFASSPAWEEGGTAGTISTNSEGLFAYLLATSPIWVVRRTINSWELLPTWLNLEAKIAPQLGLLKITSNYVLFGSFSLFLL